MPQYVSEIMTRDVETIEMETTIDRVEALFTAHQRSFVPVVDAHGEIFGIISSGDLRRFHAEKKNPKAVRAWELCTCRPKSVRPDTSLSEVAELMLKQKIHHVLIAENGNLHGLVSSLDFVRQFARPQR